MATAKAELKGEVVIRNLTDVGPNQWNPNKMTETMKASLKHGFVKDGWLVSQALLIWGTDNKGGTHDIIIDGEHRWTVARELNMTNGPMVFLDDLSEVEAKALTVKMNQKRGQVDDALLVGVLKDIEAELGHHDMAIDLGFDDETILQLMTDDAPVEPTTEAPSPKTKTPPEPKSKPETAAAGMRSAGSKVRMVQLFFDVEQKALFDAAIKKLATDYGTENVTETVLKAVLELTEDTSS